MKKAIKVLSTTLFIALAVTGCGTSSGTTSSPNNSSESSSSSSSSPSSSSNSNNTVKLTLSDRLLETSTSGGDIARRQMIDEFKKEHPNVQISEESLQDASYKTKVKALAAGNDLPDVFELLGSDAKMFLDNKLIQPIDDILNQNPDWKQGFIPSTFDDFNVDGKITGAPIQLLSTSLVFYNQAIFKKAGIDKFPATWDEFTADIKTLKDKGFIPIALGNKGKWVAESCILSTLGDRYTGTDWFASLKNNKGAKFTDQPFVQSLAALQQLAKNGAFNSDMNSIDNNQQRTLFYNGKAAMFIEGNWAISSISTDAPQDIKDNTHLAILPSVNGGAGKANSVSGGSAWAYALNANLKGEKLQAAIELVKMLTGEREANVAIEKNDVSATVPKKYDESKLSPLFKEYVSMVQNLQLTPIYDAQLTPAIIETMNNGLQNLLIQSVTPEQLAQEIQDAYSGS